MRLDLFNALRQARAAKSRAALVTDLSTGEQALVVEQETQGPLPLSASARAALEEAFAKDRSGAVDLPDGQRLFLHVFNPPRRMIVVGAVHIAQALAPMAALAGYAVTIVDPRGAWATQDRFPGVTLDARWPDEALAALGPDRRTAIVTLTHDPKLDDPALAHVLRGPAFYIGALGSRKTHAKRVERLTALGFTTEEIARINAPVGLAIGAVSPAEIAISILAQVTEALHRPVAKAGGSGGDIPS